MNPLRVCIVGAGPMGRLHAQKIAGLAAAGEAAVLSVIVDHHAARAGEVASSYGGEATADLARGLRCADLAVIATPTTNHTAVTEQALRAGLDVLVEKPMAGNVEEAQALIRTAEAEQRILQVGHVEWYNAAWRAAAARAGTPLRIEVDRLTPPSTRGLDLDVVQDLMLHDLDWVTRFVDDEVVELSAEGSCVENPLLDVAAVQLSFASGCVATLRASRVHRERRRRVRIVGKESTETADLLQAPDSGASVPGTSAARFDPLERQWKAFLDAVATREAPENSGSVGLAALRWVDRVRDSIDSSGAPR